MWVPTTNFIYSYTSQIVHPTFEFTSSTKSYIQQNYMKYVMQRFCVQRLIILSVYIYNINICFITATISLSYRHSFVINSRYQSDVMLSSWQSIQMTNKTFEILHARNSIASKYEYEFWNATLKTNEHRKSIHAFGQLESDTKW